MALNVMEKLSIAFTIFTSLLITIIIGFFLYAFIDGQRVVLYCPDGLREGGNCYAENWEFFPEWISSTVGALMAFVAVAWAALFQPKNRFISAKAMFIVGVLFAIFFSALIHSVLSLLATVLSGLFALWCVQRLTRLQ